MIVKLINKDICGKSYLRQGYKVLTIRQRHPIDLGRLANWHDLLVGLKLTSSDNQAISEENKKQDV